MIQNCSLQQLEETSLVGLTSLAVIDLSQNVLSYIYPKTFMNLTKLGKICVSENFLRELDIWPLYVGLFNECNSIPQINSSFNFISKFTNKAHFVFTKDELVRINSYLDLSFNSIQHFTDIPHGYGITNISNMEALWTGNF